MFTAFLWHFIKDICHFILWFRFVFQMTVESNKDFQRTPTSMRTTTKNIASHDCNEIEIIPTHCACETHANRPGIKLAWTALMPRVKWKFHCLCSRPLQNFGEFGHLASLFWRERQRNGPKCQTHVRGVQSHCFLLIKVIVFGETGKEMYKKCKTHVRGVQNYCLWSLRLLCFGFLVLVDIVLA